jgi:hypothetical protein
MVNEMRELADRWILPLRGSHVVRVNLGENVTFVLDSGVQIVVGNEAYFTKGSIRASHVEPTKLSQLDSKEIQQSVGAQILSPVGFKDGALRIVFDNGWQLNVSTAGPFVPAAVISGDTVLWMRAKNS